MTRIEETDLTYYEVGGSVRDRLLGENPSDRDFVIVGHTVDDVLRAGLRKVVGEDFPVFLDSEGKECAMARTEEKVSDGHHGFEIHTSPDVTLEEDLSRRDLTINAMARDPETGEIIDPFDGQEDLEGQRIRHTTDAFAEDPLRVLRAARFASSLPDIIDYDAEGDYDNGWTIDKHTMVMCRRLASKHRLDNLSEERIQDEILKALKRSEKPSKFFRVLVDMDALNAILPELSSLRRVPAGPKEHHAEGSAFEHTMLVLDKVPNTLRLRLAALAHDLGKARTPEEELPNHYGHDAEGVHIAERLGNRLKLSNEHMGVMMDAAEQHMRFMRLHKMGEGKVIDLIKRLDRSNNHISPEELLELCKADGVGRTPQKPMSLKQQSLYKWLIINSRIVIDTIGGEEVLTMHDKRPGEWVGDRIRQLRIETLRKVRNGDNSGAAATREAVADLFSFKDKADVIIDERDSLWNDIDA